MYSSLHLNDTEFNNSYMNDCICILVANTNIQRAFMHLWSKANFHKSIYIIAAEIVHVNSKLCGLYLFKKGLKCIQNIYLHFISK